MIERHVIFAIVFSLLCIPAWAGEQTAPPAGIPASQAATTQPVPRPGITVAILDFAATSVGNPDLGIQIGEALTAILSGEQGFTLVDRAGLTRALQEHELNLTGAVDDATAIRIGKLIGARILVTGKAFPLGQRLYITAKMIGTETSLVEGLLVKSDIEGDVGDLIVELATQLSDRLRAAGPKLVASDDAIDPLPALVRRLSGRKLPSVAVIVTEEHMRQQPAPVQPIDPAVETEIKALLQACGFDVVDVPQNELADWARLTAKDDPQGWPRSLHRADVVVTGEAFSEFAARIGNLVSCSARAEINVITRADGKIVLADRQTTRAVDLSENIAGKKALEKAGRALGIRILEHFAAAFPEPATQATPAQH
ncbi:MAG: hypothetical protein GXY55_06330 [Phycisphaerae bacterium]|nr:hypothetical protein [Phycisphaerae bacterium]